MLSKSCVFLTCLFVYIHGHPLISDERPAFDYINIANEGWLIHYHQDIPFH